MANQHCDGESDPGEVSAHEFHDSRSSPLCGTNRSLPISHVCLLFLITSAAPSIVDGVTIGQTVQCVKDCLSSVKLSVTHYPGGYVITLWLGMSLWQPPIGAVGLGAGEACGPEA